MSMNFSLQAEARSVTGKAECRRMRRLQARVPAVVYGAGKEPENISLTQKDMLMALDNEAVFSHILKLSIDGKEQQVVLKDLHRHPVKPQIQHVDFLRISATDKLTMSIPLHFIGEEVAPGVKAGGVVSHLMTELEIKCLPADLPQSIDIDVSQLEMDGSIHLSALELPKGVELTQVVDADHDQSIVSIHAPRSVKADDEVAADADVAEGGDDAAPAADDAAAADQGEDSA